MAKASNSPKRLGASALVSFAVVFLCAPKSFAQDAIWVTKAPMPTARSRLAAGAVDGLLYAVGGDAFFAGNAFTTVEVYDPKTDAWSGRAPLPLPCALAAAGVINRTLLVVGCPDSSRQPRTLQAYDPKTDRWTARAPMPTPRTEMVVAVVDGVLYVIGGRGLAITNTNYDTVEAYDPKSDTWTTKTPIPTARCCMVAGVIDSLIYVAGGGRSIGYSGWEAPPTLEVYDPRNDTWSTKSPMPTGRAHASGGALDGKLYVVGGPVGLSTSSLTGTVEAYDPKADSWITGAPTPTRRGYAAAAVVEDTLYVIGGINDGAVEVAVNEAFSPFLHVGIDIKPGDPENTINLRSRGTVPVAILGSATFDPTTVDPATVTLAGAPVATRPNGVPMTSITDANGDGYLDLLLHFRTQELQLTRTSTEAVLYGETFSGQRIRGADAVQAVFHGPLRLVSPWTDGANGRRHLSVD